MRQIILDRIKGMKFVENNFSKNIYRWRNFTDSDVHISEVNFENLSDDKLVFLFERLIRRFYTQM